MFKTHSDSQMSLHVPLTMLYDTVAVGPYEVDGVVITYDRSIDKIFIESPIGDNNTPFIGLVDKLIINGERVPFYIEPYCKNRVCNRYTLEPSLTVRCHNVVNGSHVLPTLNSLRDALRTQSTFRMRLGYTFNNVEVKVKNLDVGFMSIVTYDSIDIELHGPLFTSDYTV